MTDISTTSRTTTREAAERALGWLAHSGIQDHTGGCHAWFDATGSGYEALYPEVTGYYATLGSWVGGDLSKPAERAVSWLYGLLQPDGGFRCVVPAEGSDAPTSEAYRRKADRRYTFDAGIVLQGLVATTGVTPQALQLGSWLLEQQNADGSFTPFTGEQDWRDVPADWSTRPGVHQAKIAIGLLALGRALGDRRYEDAAVAAVRYAVRHQRDDGRFVTNSVTDGANIHPHSYAAEAAWVVGTATGDVSMLAAAAAATRWVLDVSRPGEAMRVWRSADDIAPHMRIDGLAQTLRLAVLTGAATPAEVSALTDTLLSYQENGGGIERDGGFRFGYSSDGRELPHVNVWVTAFAAQALLLADADGATLDWRFLV